MFRNLQLLMIFALIFNQLFACAHGHAESEKANHLQRSHIHFDLCFDSNRHCSEHASDIEQDRSTESTHQHAGHSHTGHSHAGHSHFRDCQGAHQHEYQSTVTSDDSMEIAKETLQIVAAGPVPHGNCCLIVPVSDTSGVLPTASDLQLDFSSLSFSLPIACTLKADNFGLKSSCTQIYGSVSIFCTASTRLHTLCKLQL